MVLNNRPYPDWHEGLTIRGVMECSTASKNVFAMAVQAAFPFASTLGSSMSKYIFNV